VYQPFSTETLCRQNEQPWVFVAAQVANSHFTAHKLAGSGHAEALGHGFVCFELLLHNFFLSIFDGATT